MSNVTNKREYLVEVNNLKQYFPVKTGFMKNTPLKAVDGVSFNIKPGETLGLVGESGCGKTTVGRSLLRLYTPTSGDVFFDGERVDKNSIGHMRKEMQMVFQDPYSSLNPRMTVEDIIGEPLDVHKLYSGKGERRDRILELMELVGLNAEHATRYAHEFSGGQRQRLSIARALVKKAPVYIFDDTFSALDFKTDAKLRKALKGYTEGATVLIVAQRVSTIMHAEQIVVLDEGRVMGIGTHRELLASCKTYREIAESQLSKEELA